MTAPLDPATLDELAALEQASSEAPWEPTPHAHLEAGCRCLSCYDEATVWLTSNGLSCDDVPRQEDWSGRLPERCEQQGYRFQDASLISALRNNAAALISAAREAAELREQLKQIEDATYTLEGSRNWKGQPAVAERAIASIYRRILRGQS